MRASEHLPERFNAAAWLVGRHVGEGRGDRAAIVTDDDLLTYGDVDDRVRRFAALLERAGVHRGDRVAFVLPDIPLLAIGFFGALAHGAVAVPLSTLLTPRDHAAIVADCEPRLVIVEDKERSDLLAKAVPFATVWSRAEVEAMLATTPAAPGYVATHRDAFAFLLYSSGTTGEPKGVVHLHHDMWISCETYGRTVLRISEEDRTFSVAKIFFAYGLGNSLYFPFHVGAQTILFPGRPVPEAVFEQVRRHRPTLFFGVPTAYANMLAAVAGGAAADFSSVRQGVSAGESLPGVVFDQFRKRTGVEVLDGIGSTEIGHIFLSNRSGMARPGSSGLPVEGYDLRVVDNRGDDVPRGDLGDLLVRGDSTMALYWNKHDATRAAVAGESIRTGDKYRVDEDGYFFHAGRADDMIKAGGLWVSPVEVEGVLVAHESVAECAVVGLADADGLVKPHAFVTLHEGAAADGLDVALRALVRERLAPYKCPWTFTVVAALPKTATGKIQRFLLRRP